MRVKWNRNLDGFPLNSESSANSVSGSISGVSSLSSSHSFPGGSIMVIKTRRSSTSSSTISSTSKRNLFPMEDKKSLNKLSNILNLFKISKSDKSSSFSESSTPLMSRRKYNNDVTDSGYFSSSSGQLFTTDSKRRRRANNLLLRNSAVRRSWHQLCTQNQKQQLIVSSPPPTPLSYRSNRPSSPRSASPPYSLRSCKMFEDIAESDSLQQDSVDSNSAFSELNENPANQANRSSPSETSYSLRSNGSNYSRDADSDFGRMKPHVPDLESRNDDPISQVAPKAWSSPYASSSTSSSTSPSLSSGEPYSSFINNRLNDSTAFQNRISVNVFVNTSGTMDNRDNKTSKNVLHNEVPDTGQSNTRESSFESTLTIPVQSHRPPSPSVNKSRSKAKDSAKDPWANELDKNPANQESVLNVAHSNGDRNLLIGPFNSSTTTTDEVVKVVVKKAMVPELVNLPATDCEVVMPLVKFDGDEPVTINGSSRDQGGNQSPGIQGILKDRSNGNGVHTALKSGIPKKVHFAETTRVKAKSYPVSNPQKGGKSPTLSNQDRTTVATSLTSTIGTTTTNTTSAATLTCPSFTEDSPEMKKSEVSSRNAQKTMRPEDNAAIKKKLAPSTLNTFPVTPKTVPLSLPTSKSVPTSIARPSTQAKSRLYAPRTPLQSPSTHKPPPSSSSSIKPPSSTSMKPPVSTAPAGRSVAQRAGTASARSAATLLSLQKEMEKYKKLSESQKKQIAIAKKQMSKTCLIFDGMSCVVRHLTENLTAFETPSLRREIESADQKYDEYEHQLQERQNTIDNLYAFQLELQDDIKRWIVELEREKQRHGKEKDKLLEMFECEKEALGQQHAFLMQGEEEKQFELKKRINELKVELEGKNKEIERFEAKVIELEDTLSGGKDKRLRALNEKIKYLSEEVNSLKAVLEIKDEEIRNLSQKLRIQEQQNEELPMLQQTIIVLNQRLEQLEISTNSKNETLARLTAENESLKQQFELEARLRRRISMKNEELEFALSESVCGSFETPCKMHKSFTGAIESTPSRPIARGSFLLDSSMDTDSEVFLQSHKRFRSFERIEETGKSDESSSPSTSTWNTTVYSVVEVSKDAGQIEENGYEEKKVSLDSNIPKCILDSGFEDINGLTSNTNSK